MDSEHIQMVVNISDRLNIPVATVTAVIKDWNKAFNEELKLSVRDKDLPDTYRLRFPNLLSFYSAKGLYRIKRARKIAKLDAKSTVQ